MNNDILSHHYRKFYFENEVDSLKLDFNDDIEADINSNKQENIDRIMRIEESESDGSDAADSMYGTEFNDANTEDFNDDNPESLLKFRNSISVTSTSQTHEIDYDETDFFSYEYTNDTSKSDIQENEDSNYGYSIYNPLYLSNIDGSSCICSVL